VLEQHPLLATLHRIMLCVAWSVAHHALAARSAARRATAAELALRKSELERLGQQIEPHFLFNALNAVLACRHDPEAVEAVTTALADYLRFCLARHGGPEPLGHELDAIELLLSVHEARFQGTLTGSGLANLRRRLELAGLDPRLEIEARGGGVTARVTLPADPNQHAPPEPREPQPGRLVSAATGSTDA